MVVAAAGSLLVGGAAAAGGLPPLQRAIRAVQPGGGDAAPAGRSTARPLLPPPATAPDRTASGGPAGAMTRSGTPCPNGGAKLGHGRASTGQPATTRQPSGGSSCRPGLSDPDPGKSKPKGPEDKGRGGGNGGKHRPRPPKDGRKAAPQTGVSDAQREPDSR